MHRLSGSWKTGKLLGSGRQLVGFEFLEIMTPVVCAPTLGSLDTLALVRSVHRALAVESLCLNRQEARVNTKVRRVSINCHVQIHKAIHPLLHVTFLKAFFT